MRRNLSPVSRRAPAREYAAGSGLMEQLLADAFNDDTLCDLPEYPSDADFLRDLQRRLSQQQSVLSYDQVWFSGILRGMAATAVGVVLFVGLNTLPPIFINASITGSGMLREKLVSISAGQHVLVQRLITRIQSQNPNAGRN
ncbi:MAG TPA: hypothetical protein VF531_08325 [Bacillota bacterium]